MFDLTGRTVLITGGCGQLGQQHAEAILEFGGEVVLADIVSEEEQEKVVTHLKQKYDDPICKPEISSVYMDVTDKVSIQTAVDKYVKIDVLINNAGVTKNAKNSFSIDRKIFLESINRIATISSEKSKAIKLNLNKNKLTISANNLEEGGSGIEEIEVNYNGPTLDIGFNASYLKEIINQFNGKEITILFSNSIAPTIIKDLTQSKTLYVLMPMRV